MAQWMDDESHVVFDDGQASKPGEPGFSRDAAKAHFKHDKFSYLGTPNWQPPVVVEPGYVAPEPQPDEGGS